jgi:hypothetical protein
MIVFADKSAVYTRKRSLSIENGHDENVKKFKILPYYVNEDLELLKHIGMSKEEIDLFVKKLDTNDNIGKYDQIIQRIIHFTDITTRLK